MPMPTVPSPLLAAKPITTPQERSSKGRFDNDTSPCGTWVEGVYCTGMNLLPWNSRKGLCVAPRLPHTLAGCPYLTPGNGRTL